MHKYLFSVVIPIYNCESYLKEAIESVINQTIGFENIELILVNDGSPDNSEKICLEYKNKYDNVIYIKQKNSGVSEARNNGLKHATGKYVNFLDSDDKWEKDVFEKAEKIFSNNKDVNIIGVRQKYFEALNHYLKSLDYKFKDNEDGVYDIIENYNYIQLSVTSAFIRTEVAKLSQFDKRIKYSEDAKYLCELFINTKSTKLGLISSSLHLYRKRKEGNSAIQSKDYKLDWYNQTVELSYKYVLDKCKKEFPEIKNYILSYIVYDYQFRLLKNLNNIHVLTKEDREKYITNTINLLKEVDDEIILSQYSIKNITKELMLLKKGNTQDEILEKIFKYKKNHKYPIGVEINSLNILDNKLLIEGNINLYYNSKLKAYIKNNDKKYNLKLEKNIYLSQNMFDEKQYNIRFSYEIPLENKNNLSFYIKYKNEEIKLIPEFKYNSRIGNYKNAYRQIYKYNITLNKTNIIVSKRNAFISEIKLQMYLLKTRKLKTIIYRDICLIAKLFKGKKEIWILSDQIDKAGDNAEALLNYLIKVNNPNIKLYFALSKNSKDVNRISKKCKVLNFKSFKYNIIFTMADKIISSQAEKYVYSAFGSYKEYMSNLFTFKYIFLQHGITDKDLSVWLNKNKFQFDLFFTSTKKEYDLIVNDPIYDYDEKVVKLTGFPRYDNLKSSKNKYHSILIAPTWRASLVPQVKPGTQNRVYNEEFKNSEYYKFYDKLFKDKEFIDTLKKYNYKIRYALHYCLRCQLKDYKLYENIELIDYPNYQYEFTHNDLLITDYSIADADFAYLKRPIIYNQFDKDEYYKSQMSENNYYDYEKEGFGKVVYDYDSLKNEIINLIKNDCKNSNKYIKRIDNTFKYMDHNNSKRVYKEILKLK